ncbi:AbiH family protein [Bordetella flabilis]|uniref:AbiH family protein n=1 Tax=Bordetella flabilis TaxID=463014 RepID=UPI0012F50BDA
MASPFALPTKLYVIGNGFDPWHGIRSSYAQFKERNRACAGSFLLGCGTPLRSGIAKDA